MAPVKPMGTDQRIGFHQAYNQDPGHRQDLNPEAVSDASVLPPPLTSHGKAPKSAKKKSAKAKK